jgi:hypothetical protein
MLTYTFSMREKVLLAILGFVGVGILWYFFVYSNIQGQIATIDSEIAAAQDELVVAQSQSAAYANMEKMVEEYKSKGATTLTMPNYDNTQSLMAFLNGILGGTKGYTINFDDPVLDETDGYVHRSGTITFNSSSYTDARGVIDAIARGPYPCRVDGVGVVDDSVKTNTKSSNTTNDAPVVVNLQLTYFEKPTGNMVVKTEDNIPEGNDWSQYMNK